MKKIFKSLTLTAILFAAVSCSKAPINTPKEDKGGNDPIATERKCATMEVLAANIKENPEILSRMKAIEEQTNRFINRAVDGKSTEGVPFTGTVNIPVKVHVIYNTAQQNISDAQIQSQIDVLNKDYTATNADVNNTPSIFTSSVSNFDIHFTLSSVDRKQSSKTSWGTRDAMKKSKQGGVDPVDPAHYLNIWVCNIGGGILGYAQFPGGSAATDGVVIGPQYFGNTGYVAAPYDKGRTATHEIGHWLNLRHIWGDANCGDDLVSDTPQHNAANYGCPAYPHLSTCAGTPVEMTMNYMDYTDDLCMYMFSNGQKTRTRAIFASDGARSSFVQ